VLIPEVDFIDDIGMRLETILKERLPDQLAAIEAPLTPPELGPDAYRQGSILLWLEPDYLPCVTIADEPPGGGRFQSIGIGTDQLTQLPGVEGRYTFYIYYAMEFRPTELAHRVVRKAAGAIQKVLLRHALFDEEVGWKEGWVRDVFSGSGKEGKLTFCVGTCVFSCSRHVVPAMPSSVIGGS